MKLLIHTLGVIFILFTSVCINSCELDADSGENKIYTKIINADIDTFTIWDKSSIYIIESKDFKINDTLIIQEGVTVRLLSSKGDKITVTENGVISAQGSDALPITFTSFNDQEHGRVQKVDHQLPFPKPGDWSGIFIYSKSASFFSKCKFYYGGGNEGKSTIIANEGTVVNILNCLFDSNDGGTPGTGKGVVDISKSDKLSSVRFNTFYNNNIPLRINGNININSTNNFYHPSDLTIVNKYNAIFVDTKKPINGYTDWDEEDVAFVIDGEKLEVVDEGQLALGNYLVLKFIKDSKLVLSGVNSIINSDGPGVYFTSFYDDSLKGDTNGDGSASKPSATDWKGVKADGKYLTRNNIIYSSNTDNE